MFSFNNPFGACPVCDGLGSKLYFDPELVVPDETKSLRGGAVAPWANSSSQYYMQALESLAKHYKFSLTLQWQELPKKVRDIILFGSGDDAITMSFDDGVRSYKTTKPFEGVITNMERRFRETDSSWIRDELSRFQATSPCEACNGQRLKPEALAVKIDGLNVAQVTDFSILQAAEWFGALGGKLTSKQADIAQRILKEINERLGFLNSVGLEYLTLSRASATLSGGESQRIRLASQIGSGLTGVLYVLDEIARGTGKDPFELRRALLDKHPRHKGALELAAKQAGWSKPLAGKDRARGIAVHESFDTVVAQVVEISRRKDGIDIDRVVCAVDCGVAVNPNIVAMQMESGIGFGLSAALMGAITLKEGMVEQSNFHDYPVLRMSQAPRIEVHIVPSGAKPTGVGEPATPVIAPALANALAALGGKPVRALPLSGQGFSFI